MRVGEGFCVNLQTNCFYSPFPIPLIVPISEIRELLQAVTVNNKD